MRSMRCCLTIGPQWRLLAMDVELERQRVNVMMDAELGDSDYETEVSGKVVALVPDPQSVGTVDRYFLQMGFITEARLSRQGVKEMKIMFRPGQSKFEWPDHRASLQCPKCQKRAAADDDMPEARRAPLVLCAQMAHQRAPASDDPGAPVQEGMRLIYRLWCKACFLSAVPAAEELLAQASHRPRRDEVPEAYTAMLYFDQTGLNAAYCKYYSQIVVGYQGGRISKSRTAANRGQTVGILSADCASCGASGVTKKCSKCKLVSCARARARADGAWRPLRVGARLQPPRGGPYAHRPTSQPHGPRALTPAPRPRLPAAPDTTDRLLARLPGATLEGAQEELHATRAMKPSPCGHALAMRPSRAAPIARMRHARRSRRWAHRHRRTGGTHADGRN